MFPELKHYLCDKEVNIKQTVIGNLEMLAQKFEDYYGEVLTPSDENAWILDPFAGTDLPHLPLHVIKEFMDMTTEAFVIRKLIPFATTWFCKTAYSALCVLKTKRRNRLDVETDLRLCISKVKPRFQKLADAKQAQLSH